MFPNPSRPWMSSSPVSDPLSLVTSRLVPLPFYSIQPQTHVVVYHHSYHYQFTPIVNFASLHRQYSYFLLTFLQSFSYSGVVQQLSSSPLQSSTPQTNRYSFNRFVITTLQPSLHSALGSNPARFSLRSICIRLCSPALHKFLPDD